MTQTIKINDPIQKFTSMTWHINSLQVWLYNGFSVSLIY